MFSNSVFQIIYDKIQNLGTGIYLFGHITCKIGSKCYTFLDFLQSHFPFLFSLHCLHIFYFSLNFSMFRVDVTNFGCIFESSTRFLDIMMPSSYPIIIKQQYLKDRPMFNKFSLSSPVDSKVQPSLRTIILDFYSRHSLTTVHPIVHCDFINMHYNFILQLHADFAQVPISTWSYLVLQKLLH